MVLYKEKMNDLKSFKNELRNYQYYLDTYEEKVKAINEQIDLLYYQLYGTGNKGGELVVNTNQSIKEERRLETLDKIEDLRHRKELLYYKQKFIEDVLNICEHKDLLVRVYARKETLEKVGREIGYSARGLQRILDKELEKNLKKINSPR